MLFFVLHLFVVNNVFYNSFLSLSFGFILAGMNIGQFANYSVSMSF